MVQPNATTSIYGTPPELGDGKTAREAYQALQPWAEQWASDTQFVAVSTSRLKTEAHSGGWSFQAYSAAQNKLAIVLVQPDKIWVLREKNALYQQRPIDIDAWQVDSDQILKRWWETRGASLWAYNIAHSLYMHLGEREDGRLVWQINVLSTGGELLESWEVDARTGDALSGGIP
ncbi:MAG: PepSY domain-containing protein [Anaerolineales bacterium]